MQKQYKLSLACRNSTNPHIKGYCKRYCNIKPKVIKEAKKRHYDNQIKYSTNKNKTTWDIVNKETHRRTHSTNTKFLSIDGITTDKHFRLNSEIHDFNTKNKSNLHLPPKIDSFPKGTLLLWNQGLQ